MEVGLFGKLPSHGDFLRRRVPDEFIGVWDAWLQQCVAASRADLNERWLDVYLTSPVWRFVCDAGACGAQSFAGIMAPSVDRVGRYFPLTLMWQVPEGVAPLAVARRADRWFDAAERAVLEILAAERVEFDAFDARVASLAQTLEGVSWHGSVELDPVRATQVVDAADGQWQLPLGVPPAWEAIVEQLLSARLRSTHAPLVLFWTEGSAAVEPSCLLSRGLPAPHSYAALLDGSWRQQGWTAIPALVAPAPAHDTTLVNEPVPLSFRSSALSDVGRVRSINQDAFLERAEIGLWAVADGMGGHSDGDVASRMVCDALAEMPPAANLEDSIEAVRERLQAVNLYLQRVAARKANSVASGSTVVVLLTQGDRAAILWAGDSRVYRLREQRLEALTHDHSWASMIGGADADSNEITRAVGGEENLLLDVCYERVQPGNRYLLCSDGLTRELADERIAELLAQSSVDHCARELVAAAVAAGGRDNVTAVVIEADGRVI